VSAASAEAIAGLATAIARQAESLAHLVQDAGFTAGQFHPLVNAQTAKVLRNAETLRAWVPNENQAPSAVTR
jgi:hypothetical protein